MANNNWDIAKEEARKKFESVTVEGESWETQRHRLHGVKVRVQMGFEMINNITVDVRYVEKHLYLRKSELDEFEHTLSEQFRKESDEEHKLALKDWEKESLSLFLRGETFKKRKAGAKITFCIHLEGDNQVLYFSN